MLICINSVRKLKDLGTKESMNQIVEKNKKLQEGDNHKLMEGKIVYLEKKIRQKGEQYSCRNMQISGIPSNSIPDKDLENTVMSICRDRYRYWITKLRY